MKSSGVHSVSEAFDTCTNRDTRGSSLSLRRNDIKTNKMEDCRPLMKIRGVTAPQLHHHGQQKRVPLMTGKLSKGEKKNHKEPGLEHGEVSG